MRLDGDFDDNMKELTRYAILICIVLIALWFLISIVKIVFPSQKTAIENKKMLKSDTSIENTLSDLVDENVADDNLIFDDSKKTYSYTNKRFNVYISDLPEDIYYPNIYTQEKEQAEKRASINKKVGDNYIDSVLSYGTLVRWNPESFPLKVYIKLSENVPGYHMQEIKSAFKRWEESTQGFISFTYVDSADKANIVCSYPENFVRACDTNTYSSPSRQYFTYDEKGNILRSNIEFTYNDCNGENYAQDMVYAIALREIGHSLGLRGHSGGSNDNILYYPEPSREHSVRPVINKSDLNTLRLVYSIKPDKIDKALSSEQNQKLIKPDDVWGEKFDRSVASEKAMLYNLKMSPEVPDLYVTLANYYKEKGEYDKAISIYSRSIVIMNNAELKSKVYARVGDTYNLQARYEEAVEAYKLSLKSLNNKQALFDVYFNLGVVYYKDGKLQDAILSFQKAIKYVYDRENSFRVLVNLAELYLKAGNYVNAAKCAEKAYTIKSDALSAYVYAYSLYKNSEFAKSQALMEEYINKSANARLYLLLAKIYHETQQYDKLDALAVQAAGVFHGQKIFTFK
ncbi:tetratricopeptide repeat protein [bacterium]|nr:tetratricopeptide repeat protein [bacterium]